MRINLALTLLLFCGANAISATANRHALENPYTVKTDTVGAHQIAVADFDADGGFELLTLKLPSIYQTIVFGGQPPNEQKAKELLKKFRWSDSFRFIDEDGKTSSNLIIEGDLTQCLHAGQISVADFNDDSIPDVLVPCSGYDAVPFPGSHVFVLLSTSAGKFDAIKLSSKSAFYHDSDAIDVNNDGLLDPISVSPEKGVLYYENLGNGKFSSEKKIYKPFTDRLYTVDGIDINDDGLVDLIVAGKSARIMENKGTGKFKKGRKLPPAKGWSPLDYKLVNGNLYAIHTGTGQNAYIGALIQEIDLETLKVTGEISHTKKHPVLLYPAKVSEDRVVFKSLRRDLRQTDFEISRGGMRFLNAP